MCEKKRIEMNYRKSFKCKDIFKKQLVYEVHVYCLLFQWHHRDVWSTYILQMMLYKIVKRRDQNLQKILEQ